MVYMREDNLKPLFQKVLDETYSDSSDDKELLKHIIYLCETDGVNIGEYSCGYMLFTLIAYPPLDRVIDLLIFAPYTSAFYDELPIRTINKIRKVIAIGKSHGYKTLDWLKCVCLIINLTKTALFKEIPQNPIPAALPIPEWLSVLKEYPMLRGDKCYDIVYDTVQQWIHSHASAYSDEDYKKAHDKVQAWIKDKKYNKGDTEI